MASSRPRPPFTPKSKAYLEVGHYWPIALSGGRWAAGVVVSTPDRTPTDEPMGLKLITAGVLDWVGPEEPTDYALRGARLLDWGTAHVRMIQKNEGRIVGRLAHPLNEIPRLSHLLGETVWLYSNGIRLRPASADERATLPVCALWGHEFDGALAERQFVKGISLDTVHARDQEMRHALEQVSKAIAPPPSERSPGTA